MYVCMCVFERERERLARCTLPERARRRRRRVILMPRCHLEPRRHPVTWRGEKPGLRGRETQQSTLVACARVQVSKSLFTCLLHAFCPKKGKSSKNNAFYLSFEPLPGILFRVPIHCINVRHINTEQNQEKTLCGMISYCGNLICLIQSNLPIICLSKMKFVQKSR